MFQRGNRKLRRRPSRGKKSVVQALGALILLALSISFFPLVTFGSGHRLDFSYTISDREHDDRVSMAESYMTTRREAIVDYVRALQAPEGYFHGWLDAPPPFEPDRTEATWVSIQDAYGVLDYIDCVDELDLSNTTEFLLSLVVDGFLNYSRIEGPSGWTSWTALTLLPNLGIDADIDIAANAELVAGMQQMNGGFLLESSETIPDLVRTYFALDTLRIAGRLDLINLAAARVFVVSCYNDDGGFSIIPGIESDFNYAPAGIMLMEILGLRDMLDVNRTTDYLLQYWDNESGCSIFADLLYTQRIAWSLWLLDRKNSIDTAKLVQWVLSLQKHTRGEFVGYPEGGLDNERLFFAYLAMNILAMYNGTDFLDSEFLVEQKPMWTIPQWWIDYINSEWGTISDQDSGFHLWFVNPFFIISLGVSLGIATPLVCIYLVIKKSDERSSAQAEAKNEGQRLS